MARRTAEIGIRLALGARRGQIVALALGESLWLMLAGIAVGIPLALAGAQYLKALLFGVAPTDPVTFAVSAATLLAVAGAAAYLPVRRALAVDPSSALRYE